MVSSAGTSEIVEINDELTSIHLPAGSKKLSIRVRADKPDAYTVEDDLDRLIKAIDMRTSSRVLGPSSQAASELLRKDIFKRPARVEISQASGIGISESVTLKQALRKLCISQASEMAAMKRLTKPLGASRNSEAGMIKRLYASVVDEEKRNVVEISIMPEEMVVDSSVTSNKYSKAENMESSVQTAMPPSEEASSNKLKLPKMRIQDVINPTSAEAGESLSDVQAKKEKVSSKATLPSSQKSITLHKPIMTSRIVKPVFRGKTSVRKKGKKELSLAEGGLCQCSEANKNGALPTKTKERCPKETSCSVPNNIDPTSPVSENIDSNASEIASTPSKIVGAKMSECSRSREKGECSHSSKSSIGDYSSSTSISDESHQSVVSSNGNRPHMSKDVRWTSIQDVVNQHGGLGLNNFDLLKKLGCGDIGTVYVAELVGTECLFALKVMDIDFLISRKKMLRAQTEREILQMLDHPFLPTLYAHFTTDNLSCLVMEYCPGGDLHVLRQKQPGRCFTEPAARFYVAEVLLALEYLHMLGVIYRDLKPENILVREDGHIMLSDFDLSLRCSVSPMLVRSSFDSQESSRKLAGPCSENSCIEPLCLQPSWVQASCFTPRLVSSAAVKARKPKADGNVHVNSLPQLVVEPTEARSNSFVGTHEYLAPEIIRGDGHGSAVDWWTFGIFLYELLFGRTPFKGPGNEETLANVISQSLKFPENPAVSSHARDLIRGLLVKEPENRLGSVKGAAKIKKHPFFEGLNWALIRCAAPPEVLREGYDVGTPLVVQKKKAGRCLDFRTNGEDVEFEIF